MISPGIRYMLISTLFFSLMGIGVKSLPHIPSHQIVFFRALVSLVACWVWLRASGTNPWGNDKLFLLLRGLFGTCTLMMFFYTLQRLPFVSAVTILYLSPIFTSLFAAIFLKERIRLIQVVCFFVAFGGVLIVEGFDPRISVNVLMIGIGGAVFSALAYIVVRKLRKTDTAMVVVFYFPLVTVPIVGPYTIANWTPPSPTDWVILVSIGVVVTLAQVYLTKALQAEKATVVSIFKYVGVINASLFGWLIFDEVVPWQSFVGILIIIGSVIVSTRYRHA